MKYKYSIRCIDASTVVFETPTNIDFHTVSTNAIAFDDMYINMANVIYIRKEVVEEDGAEND